tara:strand:+ start:6863 stop:7276 length:414 start_codon:yes stop_codon:yes gene_type:complete
MKINNKILFTFFLIVLMVYLFSINKSEFTVKIKVAKNNNEKKRGLMFRNNLDIKEGMLFKNINSVWMKNTLIPLDVIFLDNHYRVVDFVEDTVPLSLDSIKIDKKSNHILEVASGFIRKNNVKKGSKMIGIEIDKLT